MSEKRSLCIFGGTFSPIHRGHVAVIRAYLAQYRPERMLIMPAAASPKKAPDPGASAEDRLQMARLACTVLPGYGETLEVSDYEIGAGACSFTYQTLTHFSSPDTVLTFLCGGDMFLSMEHWRCAERIFRLARIAYAERGGDRAQSTETARKAEYYRKKFGADIVPVIGEHVEISSTALRRAIGAGENTDAYLDPRVRAYIESRGLYRGAGVISYDT